MPTRPPHPCAQAGCPVLLTEGAYCPKHQPKRNRQWQDRHYDQTKRDESWKEYGGARWKKVRAAYLSKHPVCECCGKNQSKLVHHVQPFRDNPDLRYEESNLRAMCYPCHNCLHKGNGIGGMSKSVNN